MKDRTFDNKSIAWAREQWWKAVIKAYLDTGMFSYPVEKESAENVWPIQDIKLMEELRNYAGVILVRPRRSGMAQAYREAMEKYIAEWKPTKEEKDAFRRETLVERETWRYCGQSFNTFYGGVDPIDEKEEETKPPLKTTTIEDYYKPIGFNKFFCRSRLSPKWDLHGFRKHPFAENETDDTTSSDTPSIINE